MKTGAMATILLLGLLLTSGGCAGGPAASASTNAAVSITADEFAQTNHISRDVEIAPGGELTLTLGSNPTTGFSWDEVARIADPNVVEQIGHEFVGPEDQNVVGAGGSEVWTFNALQAGTTTVSLAYSRPWEGGEKGVWTLDLTVSVK